MIRFARFVWELPQNLLGMANLVLQRSMGNVRQIEREDGRVMVELRGDGAVSLGWFVFHSRHDGPFVPVGAENRQHERGHSVQSRWLGPLYLPLVGVPSVLRVLYAMTYRARHGRRWPHYYDGWPERSADQLGHVDRALRPAP